MAQKVFLISGTYGAGKTTVSKLMTRTLENTVHIHADDFLDMTEHLDMDWHDRLHLLWSSAIAVAHEAIASGLNVVIDCVIEDELPRLTTAFAGHHVYHRILIAEPEVLKSRLTTRGDAKHIPRGMLLLEQYLAEPGNKPFMIDTSRLTPEEVMGLILEAKPIHD